MKMEQYIRLIAGFFVVTSTLLGLLVNPWWFAFTLFVGVNLAQSALTGWCLMESFLARLGVQTGSQAAAARVKA